MIIVIYDPCAATVSQWGSSRGLRSGSGAVELCRRRNFSGGVKWGEAPGTVGLGSRAAAMPPPLASQPAYQAAVSGSSLIPTSLIDICWRYWSLPCWMDPQRPLNYPVCRQLAAPRCGSMADRRLSESLSGYFWRATQNKRVVHNNDWRGWAEEVCVRVWVCVSVRMCMCVCV